MCKKLKIRTIFIISSPILLFLLLLPNVKYQSFSHGNLLGQIDARVGKLGTILLLLNINIVLYFIKIKVKQKFVRTISILYLNYLNIVMILSSLVSITNIYTDFYKYFISSTGNIISFIILFSFYLLFVVLDYLPRNIIFGIKTRLTISSESVWREVHKKMEIPIFLISLISTYLFLNPVISSGGKVLINFFAVILCFIVGMFINHRVETTYNKIE